MGRFSSDRHVSGRTKTTFDHGTLMTARMGSAYWLHSSRLERNSRLLIRAAERVGAI
jgi:hypothetical protein